MKRINARRHLRSQFSKPRDIELLSAMQFQSHGTGGSSITTAPSPAEEKSPDNRIRSEWEFVLIYGTPLSGIGSYCYCCGRFVGCWADIKEMRRECMSTRAKDPMLYFSYLFLYTRYSNQYTCRDDMMTACPAVIQLTWWDFHPF